MPAGLRLRLRGGTKGLKVSAASSNPMAPDENLADGNTCCDDEELFEGMCYKKRGSQELFQARH